MKGKVKKSDMMLVKICGINEAEMAKYAIKAGAHYIGMIFHPASRRAITLEQAKRVTEATLKTRGKPVVVVVNQTADEIVEVCRMLGVNIVQLHGVIAKQQEYLLPNDLHRIYVCQVNYDGTLAESPSTNLDIARDFLLFDGMNAGSGKTFNWQKFKYLGPFRWFLSGGLAPDNIQAAVHSLHPIGVDVSSGVEDSSGNKNKQRIVTFINKIKQTRV